MEENNVKRRRGKGVFLVIVLFIVVGVMAVASLGMQSKEVIVAKALLQIFGSDSENYMEQVVGIKATNEKMKTQSYEQGFDFNIDKMAKILDPEGDLFKGTYFSYISSRDDKNKSMSGTMEMGSKDGALFNVATYFDSEFTMFEIPQLADKFVSWNYSIGDKREAEEIKMLRQYTESLYEAAFPDKNVVTRTLAERLFVGQGGNTSSLVTDLKITEAGEKIIKLEGQEKKCQGYEIYLSQEMLDTFIDDIVKGIIEDEQYKEDYINALNLFQILSLFDYEVSSDSVLEEEWEMYVERLEEIGETIKKILNGITISIYVDSKNNPVSFVVEGDLSNPDNRRDKAFYKIEILYNGGDYLYQNYKASISIMYEEEFFQLDIEKKERVSNKRMTSETTYLFFDQDTEYFEGSITTEFDGTNKGFKTKLLSTVQVDGFPFVCYLEIKGNYTDIKKGESYTMNAEDIKLNISGINAINLSGSYYMRPLSQAVKPFEGRGVDIMTEVNYKFYEELEENMEKLIEKIEAAYYY